MTNSEKYLKEGISAQDLINFLKSNQPTNNIEMTFNDIEFWLNEKAKPTLTEDERVILKNIDLANFKAIGRKDDYLYLRYTNYCYDYGETDIKTLTFWYMYHNLFQSIKNGEEYYIKELLEDE